MIKRYSITLNPYYLNTTLMFSKAFYLLTVINYLKKNK